MAEESKDESKDKNGEKQKEPGSLEKVASGWVNALLMPSAESLGGELKDFVDAKLEAWKKQKKKQNIEGHAARVKEKLSGTYSERVSETIRAAEMLRDWIEGAQDVDPDEGPLAEMWQELLARIALGGATDQLLIEKLKKITPEQAIVLMDLGMAEGPRIAHTQKELHYLRQLHEHELVEHCYNIFGLNLSIAEVIFSFLHPRGKSYGFWSWKLSWIGEELIRKAPRSTKTNNS